MPTTAVWRHDAAYTARNARNERLGAGRLVSSTVFPSDRISIDPSHQVHKIGSPVVVHLFGSMEHPGLSLALGLEANGCRNQRELAENRGASELEG